MKYVTIRSKRGTVRIGKAIYIASQMQVKGY